MTLLQAKIPGADPWWVLVLLTLLACGMASYSLAERAFGWYP